MLNSLTYHQPTCLWIQLWQFVLDHNITCSYRAAVHAIFVTSLQSKGPQTILASWTYLISRLEENHRVQSKNIFSEIQSIKCQQIWTFFFKHLHLYRCQLHLYMYGNWSWWKMGEVKDTQIVVVTLKLNIQIWNVMLVPSIHFSELFNPTLGWLSLKRL